MVTHFEDRWRWDYLNARGIIESTPISWLEAYMLPAPDYKITDTHGNEVTDKELLKHILEEGLQHAGVIEVSRKTLKARVIAGNHRLRVAIELQQSYFPFYVIIIDEFYDPEHEGVRSPHLNEEFVIVTQGNVVAAPSAVFKDLEGRSFRKA